MFSSKRKYNFWNVCDVTIQSPFRNRKELDTLTKSLWKPSCLPTFVYLVAYLTVHKDASTGHSDHLRFINESSLISAEMNGQLQIPPFYCPQKKKKSYRLCSLSFCWINANNWTWATNPLHLEITNEHRPVNPSCFTCSDAACCQSRITDEKATNDTKATLLIETWANKSYLGL